MVAHSLQASTRQLVRIAQLGRTSEAPEDCRSKSHQPSVAEAPAGPRPGSTARVRFLRKTYQQTRQFIGEDLEPEGSSSEESEDATVATTSSDIPLPARRLSALAQHMPRKEYLWKKVQAVAFGTRRAMQQRNRLLSQLKSTIQECVERQRVAKQVQAAIAENEAGSDVLAGIRASLDDASSVMLEEIVSEGMKFQVLNIPNFVQNVLEYTMGDSEDKTALQDSLLDAMQDAMEQGGDLFELDELRSNVMNKVEAFKESLRKASTSRVQGKLNSLKHPEAEVTKAADVEAQDPLEPEEMPEMAETAIDSDDDFMSPASSYASASEARSLGAQPVAEAKSISEMELPPIEKFDAAVAMRDKALKVQEHREERWDATGGSVNQDMTAQKPSHISDLADAELEPEDLAEAPVPQPKSPRSFSMSSPRPPMIKAQSEGGRTKSHEPQMHWKKAEKSECEDQEPLTSRSEPKYRSTWHGKISEKLVVLGPATVERLVAQAEGADGSRFPVLPMYRGATKEAAKRNDFRQKQKAVSLDPDLPKLGHIQPITSFSMSKGSGRFGYTLPEPPRRKGPQTMASPRRNPPSHPAPRQMAWTLLPGIAG